MRFSSNQNSLFLLVCPWRIFDNQIVTQTEKGSGLMVYAAPLFCIFSGRGHTVRIFCVRRSGLISKDLANSGKTENSLPSHSATSYIRFSCLGFSDLINLQGFGFKNLLCKIHYCLN